MSRSREHQPKHEAILVMSTDKDIWGINGVMDNPGVVVVTSLYHGDSSSFLEVEMSGRFGWVDNSTCSSLFVLNLEQANTVVSMAIQTCF